MFYKIVENGYITQIGRPKVPSNGIEITEEKYNTLYSVMSSKPSDTLEVIYKLSNETEQYIACERTHDEIINWYGHAVLSGEITIDEVPADYKTEVEELITPAEQTYTLDEAAAIIAEEAASYE